MERVGEVRIWPPVLVTVLYGKRDERHSTVARGRGLGVQIVDPTRFACVPELTVRPKTTKSPLQLWVDTSNLYFAGNWLAGTNPFSREPPSPP